VATLFNFSWSVEKHGINPANIGMILSGKSALMASPLLALLADSG